MNAGTGAGPLPLYVSVLVPLATHTEPRTEIGLTNRASRRLHSQTFAFSSLAKL